MNSTSSHLARVNSSTKMKKKSGRCVKSSNRTAPNWAVLFNGSLLPAPRQVVSESFLRQQFKIPEDHLIFRDHNSPYDPVIAAGSEINLAEGSVFYSRQKCESTISKQSCGTPPKLVVSLDDRFEIVLKASQSKQSILELFGISKSLVLFRDLEAPSDLEIDDKSEISLKDGNVFLSRSPKKDCEVIVTINGEDYPVKKGTYVLSSLKQLPNPKISDGHQLSIVRDGRLVVLKDGEKVEICGGEVFASNAPTGGAS